MQIKLKPKQIFGVKLLLGGSTLLLLVYCFFVLFNASKPIAKVPENHNPVSVVQTDYIAKLPKEDALKECVKLMTAYEKSQNYAFALTMLKKAKTYGYTDYDKDYKRIVSEAEFK